jgi:hypothetical protein
MNESRTEIPNKKLRYSEIFKKQNNGLAGSRDEDGRKRNTQKSTGVETNR